VFLNPPGLFDRLVVLTPEAILVANPDALAMARLSANPDAAAWASALGEAPTTVPYAAITHIRTNKHGDTLTIRYRQGPRSRLMTISLKDTATRDDVWDRLYRRVGRSFVFSDVQFGRVRAAVAPVLTAAACVAATWLLSMVAAELAGGAEAEIRGRNAAVKQALVFVVDRLGPTGVIVAGTLAAASAALWGVARVRVPPRMLTLARG
jgi:hypothetical protein